MRLPELWSLGARQATEIAAMCLEPCTMNKSGVVFEKNFTYVSMFYSDSARCDCMKSRDKINGYSGWKEINKGEYPRYRTNCLVFFLFCIPRHLLENFSSSRESRRPDNPKGSHGLCEKLLKLYDAGLVAKSKALLQDFSTRKVSRFCRPDCKVKGTDR